MKHSILLVEDDLDLAQTLIDYLRLENIDCDHASNGVSAEQLALQNVYDVLLLDINLPRQNGLDVCSALRAKGLDTPILMLTARDTLQDKLKGFEVGSDDYLVKPFEMAELVARIHALAKRKSGQSRQWSVAGLVMDFQRHQVTREGQPIKLSPIGWKLLEALMQASPQVVSKAQLSQKIWGDDVPDSDALKVHLHKLRKAVDDGFSTPLIQTFPGVGFALQANQKQEPNDAT